MKWLKALFTRKYVNCGQNIHKWLIILITRNIMGSGNPVEVKIKLQDPGRQPLICWLKTAQLKEGVKRYKVIKPKHKKSVQILTERSIFCYWTRLHWTLFRAVSTSNSQPTKGEALCADITIAWVSHFNKWREKFEEGRSLSPPADTDTIYRWEWSSLKSK